MNKTEYTEEDINELKAWFDAQELPQSMQINSAAFTPDLKKTVDMLFDQAYIAYSNFKMHGCIYLLEEIKANLEKQQ